MMDQSSGKMKKTVRDSGAVVRSIAVLLLLSGVLYFTNLGGVCLSGKDEYRYAEVAQEIHRTGDWFVLRLNNEPYPDKPPLYFWMVGLFSLPEKQVGPWSARLPLALSGIATVLLAFAMGRILYDTKTGFWSGIILMVAGRYYWGIRWVRLDLPLVAFTTASLSCFGYLYFRRRGPRALLAWLFWFFIGCALLSKGPPALVVPAAVIFFLWKIREWDFWRELKWFPGIFLPILMLLAWLIPAMLGGGGEYSQEMMWDQVFVRIFRSWRHHKPIVYYLYKIFGDFQPWALFLPAALVIMWKSRKIRENEKRVTFLITWILVILIPFSLVRGKRGAYILPMYPALAIIMARYFLSIMRGGKPGLEFRIPATIIGIGILLTSAVAMIHPAILDHFDINLERISLLPLVPLLLLSLGLLLSLWRRETLVSIVLIFIIAYYLMLSPFLLFFPYQITDRPVREITGRIMNEYGPGDLVYAKDTDEYKFLLYGNYYLRRIPEGRWFDTPPGRKIFVILENKYVESLMKPWVRNRDWWIHYRTGEGKKDFTLISNQPPNK